jgi:hypothetical protein
MKKIFFFHDVNVKVKISGKENRLRSHAQSTTEAGIDYCGGTDKFVRTKYFASKNFFKLNFYRTKFLSNKIFFEQNFFRTIFFGTKFFSNKYAPTKFVLRFQAFPFTYMYVQQKI